MKSFILKLSIILITLFLVAGCLDQQMAKEVKKKNWSTVKELINRGADPNTPVKLAFGRTSTVLIQATKKGRLDIIEISLSTGADANGTDNKQRVPLQFLGSSAADVIIAERLIESGADVNYTASRNLSPLAHAVSYNNSELVNLYLREGADVNLPSSYSLTTPLIKAAERGNTSITRTLISAGAELDAQDKAGRTALMAAAGSGHQHIIDILMDSGASPDMKDNNGNDYKFYLESWQKEQEENSASSSESE